MVGTSENGPFYGGSSVVVVCEQNLADSDCLATFLEILVPNVV